MNKLTELGIRWGWLARTPDRIRRLSVEALLSLPDLTADECRTWIDQYWGHSHEAWDETGRAYRRLFLLKMGPVFPYKAGGDVASPEAIIDMLNWLGNSVYWPDHPRDLICDWALNASLTDLVAVLEADIDSAIEYRDIVQYAIDQRDLFDILGE